ncbi:HNH endonuclease [Natronococcus pandeyae]|uniref:HNH endonuclease n=1 Tax=Natronococcus pandeyae TaxID=2055836 RepID=UPI0027B950C0|nr:HNH endonuclease [Natronococcus pandeyae]
MGREPDVHHITPVREFENPQRAHTVDNLISLCRSCHRLAEIGSIDVSPSRTNNNS